MNPRFKILGLALLLVLAAGRTRVASANELTLNIQGVTDGSSSLGLVPIASRTPFDLQATFNTLSSVSIPGVTGPGYAVYTADSLQVEVNGYLYTAASASRIFLTLVDATNSAYPGLNSAAISNDNGGSTLGPAYAGTTPAGWSANNPTPVVFSGYAGSMYSLLDFTTSSGATLTLDYNPEVGIDDSLTGTAIPEGSTFSLFLMGLAVVGVGKWMGRRGMCGA
jgi:hypothetical protein